MRVVRGRKWIFRSGISGAGKSTALDVLEVVGRLNEIAAGLGEGEKTSANSTADQAQSPAADPYTVNSEFVV